MSRGSVEQERKLSAWAGFEVPDLRELGNEVEVVALPELRLEATYYDTTDLRLARSGITIRFRTGEGGDGKWTLKLPEGERGPSLVRREIDVVAAGRVVPELVASLVRGHVRSSRLATVGVVQTRRRRMELRVEGVGPVIEVADDEVSVLDGRRVGLRFRELEVELLDPAGDALIERVVDALVEAGASPTDQTPKIVRALGPRASAPPDVAVTALDDRASMLDVVRATISGAFVQLVRHEPGVRLGGDPEDVHQARVAARRLRSDLRTFRPLLDAEPTGWLRDELQWLGSELGRVRDVDVLHARLRAQSALLPAVDGRAAGGLLRRLDDERIAAGDGVVAALDSDRYLGLLDALVDAAHRPPTLEDACLPARKALPDVVRGAWRHLRKAVESLDRHPEDAALHDIRIRAKRARYAAEAAAPVLGKPTARFAKSVATVQSVLGDLQDAVVAETWLRDAAAKCPAPQAMVAGQLVALQRDAMATARRSWRHAWDELSANKLPSWRA